MRSLAGLFRFDGRTRRRDWWLIQIGMTLVQMAFAGIMTTVFVAAYTLPVMDDVTAGLVIDWALLLLVLWVSTAANARRAHDRDQRAWVAIGVQLVAFVASFFYMGPAGPFAAPDAGATVAMFLMLPCGLYLLLGLGLPDGTRGPNRYGPSPKYGGGDLGTLLD